MSWVRIDDQFADHPKVVTAGPEAAWLDVCGMCYCQRYLTDGFVPEGVVPRLVPWPEAKVKQLLERLLEVCLWEARPGGYYIHDFLKYNPSRAEVEAKRNARQTAGKVGGKRAAQAKAQANAKQMLEQNSSKVQPPTPTPIITQSTNVDCVPAPVKPNPKKREPKPEAPPAVKIVHDLTGKWPASVWYEKVDQAVGRDLPNLQRWSDTITAWLGLGWNKTNVKGMLEYLERNEIPGTNGRLIHDQRRNKNHGLAGLRGGNSEYRVLSKEEWEAAKQAQRDGIDLGDGPALPDLRLPQERVAEK